MRLSLDDFKHEMNILAQQFPRAVYSQRKSDLIYLAVKHLSSNDFRHVVDKIISNHKFAPNVDDFKELARNYQADKQQVDCLKCGGHGLVSYNYKKTGVAYAFKCSCPNGATMSDAFQCESRINKNLFTRFAPTTLNVNNDPDVDPYARLKQELKNKAQVES